MKTAEEILKGLRDWRRNFSKAWGAKNVKDLDNATQLSINWIDENVIAPVDEYIKTASQSKEESPPFPEKMTFREMITNYFNTDFLSENELTTICAAAELYAKGCLRQAEPPEEKSAY